MSWYDDDPTVIDSMRERGTLYLLKAALPAQEDE